MLEKILAGFAIVIISISIGWYYRGHLDVFVRHTAFLGSWFTELVEGTEKCPTNMLCTERTPDAGQVQ